MDFSDAEVQQLAEADRREVDPPIQVETAAWSKAGQLDWWVKERQDWWGRVRGAYGHPTSRDDHRGQVLNPFDWRLRTAAAGQRG